MIEDIEGLLIEREELIDLIKECIGEFFWRHEECMVICSDEDIKAIEDTIMTNLYLSQ